jgi:hypothetical protein
MDIAEKIGINFSNTVCLGVKINDIKSLNKNLKRGFSPDESGVCIKMKFVIIFLIVKIMMI